MNPGKIVAPSRMDERGCSAIRPATRRRCRRPRSTGGNGAAGTRRSRCATTTAIAANSTPAPCARPTAPRATSAPHARTRQYAATRAVGPTALRRCEGCARAMRVLQGLQARMPHRRRHGAHENRVSGALQQAPWPEAARPPGRLAAALRALALAQSRRWPTRPRHWASASPASPQSAPCPPGGAMRSALVLPRPRAGARWRCWSIPSTAISSPTTRARPCGCSRRPAIACTRRVRSAAGGRCAAAALSFPRASSTKPSTRQGACSRRSRPGSSAACRSSAWSRRACSRCATNSA